jgi:hypothetical protein
MEPEMWIKMIFPLLSMALIFVALPSNAYGRETVDESTLDLAAMILTPTDLGFAGMAAFPIERVEGKLQSAQDIADEYTFAKDVSAERASKVLVDTGLQQRYVHQYRLRFPDDSRSPALTGRWVTSAVYEFPDKEAAIAAFDPLSRLIAWDAPAINAGIVPIGDDSRLSRAEVPYENIEGTYPELTLTFRSGTLIASVSIADDEGEPDLAAVETLATQLLDHMTTVSDGGGSGMSGYIPRLSDFEELRENYDGYTLMGGTVVVGSAGSTDVFKTIEATAAAGAGALDGYKLSYYLVADYGAWVADFGTLIYRFYDEDEAAAWIDVLPSRLYATSAANLNVTTVPDVGHRSFVASYEGNPDDSVQNHEIGAVQVGVYVAILYGPEMDPETTREYLEAQAKCLDHDGCFDILSQSAAF